MKMRKLMKKDRKAWLRVLEAFLAVVIIMGVVLFIMSKQERKVDITDIVHERQDKILNIVSKNETLRSAIIGTGPANEDDLIVLNSEIERMIPASWNFSTYICEPNDICNMKTPNDRDVYVSEVLITSNLSTYNPRKLRLFIWMM